MSTVEARFRERLRKFVYGLYDLQQKLWTKEFRDAGVTISVAAVWAATWRAFPPDTMVELLLAMIVPEAIPLLGGETRPTIDDLLDDLPTAVGEPRPGVYFAGSKTPDDPQPDAQGAYTGSATALAEYASGLHARTHAHMSKKHRTRELAKNIMVRFYSFVEELDLNRTLECRKVFVWHLGSRDEDEINCMRRACLVAESVLMGWIGTYADPAEGISVFRPWWDLTPQEWTAPTWTPLNFSPPVAARFPSAREGRTYPNSPPYSPIVAGQQVPQRHQPNRTEDASDHVRKMPRKLEDFSKEELAASKLHKKMYSKHVRSPTDLMELHGVPAEQIKVLWEYAETWLEAKYPSTKQIWKRRRDGTTPPDVSEWTEPRELLNGLAYECKERRLRGGDDLEDENEDEDDLRNHKKSLAADQQESASMKARSLPKGFQPQSSGVRRRSAKKVQTQPRSQLLPYEKQLLLPNVGPIQPDPSITVCEEKCAPM